MHEHTAGFHLASRTFNFRYHEALVPLTLLLRLGMAWIFLWAGFHKLIAGFSAAGFLTKASSGPLHSWWVSLGESTTALSVIEPLVIWGQILIGFALLFGVATRFALFWASVMMFLFYLAQFPPEHDPFLDYFLVYIVSFLLLGAMGAGRILGLDRYVETWPFVEKAPWLKYLLG